MCSYSVVVVGGQGGCLFEETWDNGFGFEQLEACGCIVMKKESYSGHLLEVHEAAHVIIIVAAPFYLSVILPFEQYFLTHRHILFYSAKR